MPTIQVPLQSWTTIPELRKSRKFKRLADEGVALTIVGKLLKARRSEISLEMYDQLDETLDEQTRSIEFDGLTMSKADVLKLIDKLLPEDVDVASAMLTRKAGGPNYRFDQKLLMQTPIPCSNPRCKTVNHVTVDIIEACKKRGEDRRPSVSIKLAGDTEDE